MRFEFIAWMTFRVIGPHVVQ